MIANALEKSSSILVIEPAKSPINNIPILSFFTGAGFLDLGFKNAGFDIVWHNEISSRFVEGFEHGMAAITPPGEKPPKIDNTNSIIDLGPREILQEAFQGLQKSDFFGMVGGPPCPDFSVGGKNRGHEGDRGKLSQVYVNRILELQPTFFLFENVPGLLRTSKHRAFLATLIEQLAGTPFNPGQYLVDIKVLNALDYGVPQDRERVFMVGIRRDWVRKYGNFNVPTNFLDWSQILTTIADKNRDRQLALGYSHWFPWDIAKRYDNAKLKFNWPTTSPFGENPSRPDGLPDDLVIGPLVCNLEELATLPNGLEGFQAYSDKFYQIAEGDDSKKSFKRLHRWRYSPAVAYGNNEVHLHPTQPRRLTVREALRLQTVPDNFALPEEMPLSHKFKTIGNGVPVKLAQAVGLGFAKIFEI